MKMARISVRAVAGHYRVTIQGTLEGRDLGRLEAACSPALAQPTAPLTIRVTRADDIDNVARAYLDRLAARGAELVFD
jgi:hypothetical protein